MDKDAHIRALVVDDDPTTVRIIGKILEREGMKVTIATASAIATVTARKVEFDVVVSDIDMPGLDGLELIRSLRGFNLDIPVILVTGSPSFETAQRAVELGAFNYLTKPVQAKELIETVGKAANRHRLARLKRRAASLMGKPSLSPGDLLTLVDAFESTLESLQMAHQPIIRAVDHAVYGYEALLRPENERLPTPGALIRASMELGRLEDLTKTVLNRCVRSLSECPDRLFVNLLPEEFNSLDVANLIPQALHGRLVFELSDNERLDGIGDLATKVAEVNRTGAQIAVDDLGVGRAGLGSFALITPMYAKIDMGLVFNIDTDADKRDVVAGLVDVCHREDIIVIAEGVETEAEFVACKKIGCDLLQGHFIAEPGFGFPDIGALPA